MRPEYDFYMGVVMGAGVFISEGRTAEAKVETAQAKKALEHAIETGDLEDIAEILLKHEFQSPRSSDTQPIVAHQADLPRIAVKANHKIYCLISNHGHPLGSEKQKEEARKLALEIAENLKQAYYLSSIDDMELRKLLKNTGSLFKVDENQYLAVKRHAIFHGFRSTAQYLISEVNKAYQNGDREYLKASLTMLGVKEGNSDSVVDQVWGKLRLREQARQESYRGLFKSEHLRTLVESMGVIHIKKGVSPLVVWLARLNGYRDTAKYIISKINEADERQDGANLKKYLGMLEGVDQKGGVSVNEPTKKRSFSVPAKKQNKQSAVVTEDDSNEERSNII